MKTALHRLRPAARAVASLGLLALLGACASTSVPSDASAVGRPATVAQAEAALPTAWQAPQAGTAAAAGAVSRPTANALGADWWRQFDDPALPALIEAARQASPTLSSARAALAGAEAARTAAASLLAPRAQATASGLRSREAPAGDIASVFSVGVQASWELDLFGGQRAAEQAAARRLEAARADGQAAALAVVADTVGSLIGLRACEAGAAQAADDARSRAETARLTELTARVGFTAPADAALARAGAAQARSQALQQRAACDQAVKALVALTALDEGRLRALLQPGQSRLPVVPALAPASLPAALVQQRPDLVAAARRVQAAQADQGQAEAALKPSLALTGSLSRSRIDAAGFSTTGNVWSFGPLQLTVPLFDSGQRTAAVDAARASADDAVVQYAAALRRAVREVEDALVALDATGARQADAESAARDFAAVLKATEQRQRTGLSSLFELEDARRQTLAAQAALVELQRERATAWVSLARALGGGWTPNP